MSREGVIKVIEDGHDIAVHSIFGRGDDIEDSIFFILVFFIDF